MERRSGLESFAEQANPGKPMLSQLAAKLATMSGGNFDRVIQARAH